MGPSIDAVMRRRYWMSSLVRVAVLVIVIWGLMNWIGDVLRNLQSLSQFSVFMLIRLSAPLQLVILGLVVLWFEKRVVGWVFPLPRRGCPGCGYPMEGRRVCPECGLGLGGGEERSGAAARGGGTRPVAGSGVDAPPGYADVR